MIVQILPSVVIFLNILLAFFVLSQNPKQSNNQLFSLLAFLGAVWISANFLTDSLSSIFWLKTSYAIGALVISVGLIWVLLITEGNLSKSKVYVISLIAVLFFATSYVNGFISHSNNISLLGDINETGPGWGLMIYAIFYFSIALLILIKLYSAIRRTKDGEKKHQFKYVFFGALITLVVTSLTTFVFPYYFSLFLLSSIDSIGFLIFLLFIAYSITRHHLFNIKVLAIELVTFALWTIILIRIILADSVKDALANGSLLAITIIFGVILIRSVLHEIRQRDKIDKLTDELHKVYGQLGKMTDIVDHNGSSR